MIPPLLHIGYHKTATTWMQRQLFQPVHGYHPLAGHRAISEQLVRPHGLDYDPDRAAAWFAAQMAACPAGPVPVLSSEILSGNPFYSGRESEVYAERLARLAPGARILISIRNQLRALPSLYMQYLLRGGTLPPERFFAGTTEPGYFAFDPVHFRYDRLVARYQALFGRESVYLLTQESLLADMEAAAAGLAAFCGNTAFRGLAPEARAVHAPGYPEHAAPILRRINHIQASVINPTPIVALGRSPGGLYRLAGGLLRRAPLGRILAGRRPVSDHVRARFSTYFRDSNARLAALAAHPLDLAGYP